MINLTIAQIESLFLSQPYQTRDLYKFLVEVANKRKRNNFVGIFDICIDGKSVFSYSFYSLSEKFQINNIVYLNPSMGVFGLTINKM